MQRPLGRQAELAQQPPHADRRQLHLELAADQLADHVTGPQREREPQLPRVVADHQRIQPAQLGTRQLGTPAWHRPGPERLQAAFAVGGHPAKDGGAGHPQRLGDGLGVGALLDLVDRADA
jgi:hypothetical protein